eukprot:1845371-Pleurochrysis_carterae.AAC.6
MTWVICELISASFMELLKQKAAACIRQEPCPARASPAPHRRAPLRCFGQVDRTTAGETIEMMLHITNLNLCKQ